jgi:hypothetical protein
VAAAVVAAVGLTADDVVDVRFTAYAVAAAFAFRRNAFASDPIRMRVADSLRCLSSRGDCTRLANPRCHKQSALLSSW